MGGRFKRKERDVYFLVAQMVKNLPTGRVQSLGWDDPLEEGMVTHCSVLAWRIPRTEEPGGLQSTGLQSQTRVSDYLTHTHTHTHTHTSVCS